MTMLNSQKQMMQTQSQILETQGLYNLGPYYPPDNLTKKVWLDYVGKLGHTPLLPKTLQETRDCLGKSSMIEIVNGLGQFVSSKDKFSRKQLRIKDFYYFMLDSDRDLMGENQLELPSYLGLLLLLEKTYAMNDVDLNFRQLSIGMIVLSKTGSRLDKIIKQFRLLEPKKDWISEEKLYTIILGTFKLLYSLENERSWKKEELVSNVTNITQCCLNQFGAMKDLDNCPFRVMTITLDNWVLYRVRQRMLDMIPTIPVNNGESPTRISKKLDKKSSLLEETEDHACELDHQENMIRVCYMLGISKGSPKYTPLSSIKMNTHRVSYLTNMYRFEVDDIFTLFEDYCDDDGLINRLNYNSAFRKLRARVCKRTELSSGEKLEWASCVDSIWEEYRVIGLNWIEYTYLMTGLSVLTGGQRNEKIESCFQLLTKDVGESAISQDDMKLYLTGIGKMLYLFQPDLREKLGVIPEELATATTEDAFNNPDLTQAGQLNLSEFRKWSQVENVYSKKEVRKSNRTRRTPIRFSPS